MTTIAMPLRSGFRSQRWEDNGITPAKCVDKTGQGPKRGHRIPHPPVESGGEVWLFGTIAGPSQNSGDNSYVWHVSTTRISPSDKETFLHVPGEICNTRRYDKGRLYKPILYSIKYSETESSSRITLHTSANNCDLNYVCPLFAIGHTLRGIGQ